MHKDKDLTIYMTIANVDNTVEMTAGYDPVKKEYYMPSLNFKGGHPLGPDYYDSENYIFETFWPFLKRWDERMLTEEDKKEFPKWVELNDENVLDLLDIFEQAVEFGWDKLETYGKDTV